MNAAVLGDVVNLRKQLDEGLSPNGTDETGQTLLHAACYSGNLACADLLLERGADVNATTTIFEETPLHLACRQGHVEVVALLLRQGAKAMLTDRFGATPLHIAARSNNIDCLELILESAGSRLGKFIDQADEEGDTALHDAVTKGYCDCAELLLTHRANFKLSNNHGKTVIQLIQGEAMRAIFRKYADVSNHISASGSIPEIHLADGESTTDTGLESEYGCELEDEDWQDDSSSVSQCESPRPLGLPPTLAEDGLNETLSIKFELPPRSQLKRPCFRVKFKTNAGGKEVAINEKVFTNSDFENFMHQMNTFRTKLLSYRKDSIPKTASIANLILGL